MVRKVSLYSALKKKSDKQQHLMLTDTRRERLIIRNNLGIPHRKLKYFFGTKLRCKIRWECYEWMDIEYMCGICVSCNFRLYNYQICCCGMFFHVPLPSFFVVSFDFQHECFRCMPISFVAGFNLIYGSSSDHLTCSSLNFLKSALP